MDKVRIATLMEKRERLLGKLDSLGTKAMQTKAQLATIEAELRAAAEEIKAQQAGAPSA